MNQDKLKAQFVAQYLYQDVIVYGESDKPRTVTSLDISYSTADYYLLLRTVSQLTDEELFNVANIIRPFRGILLRIDRVESQTSDFCFHVIRDFKHIKSANPKEEISMSVSLWQNGTFYCGDGGGFIDKFVNIEVFNYLRSIGTILPFTFINSQDQPETYSLEKLLELGWCKIKEI